ncbi:MULTISPECIES: helix-turn-helix transcriptional regulator [unclassified Streptomyces]|uniref:helix-turn-helix domain-containing protein n=1 Tax=unclassified Streptomyces TaxID=2593676 RepID=UPI00278C68B1|nr:MULTISPECIES: helix-turn-helix transcriptional regulator [unclassified Streptomyces]
MHAYPVAVTYPVAATHPAAATPPDVAQEDWRTVFTRIATLSERELEVFKTLGEGASNRRIARQLAITERTVKAHVAQVLTKLRLESRLQAGIVAFAWSRPATLAEGPPFAPAPGLIPHRPGATAR